MKTMQLNGELRPRVIRHIGIGERYTSVHSKLSVETVLNFSVDILCVQEQRHTPVSVNGSKLVKVKDTLSVRSLNLYRNQPCATCGRITDYFLIEANELGYHINGYSSDHMMMTCDHIVPKSKGGADVLKNTQMMCKLCNSSKRNISMEEFKSNLDFLNFKVDITLHVINKRFLKFLDKYKDVLMHPMYGIEIKENGLTLNLKNVTPFYLDFITAKFRHVLLKEFKLHTYLEVEKL